LEDLLVYKKIKTNIPIHRSSPRSMPNLQIDFFDSGMDVYPIDIFGNMFNV